jgi:E3 SUMO-protein ligase PIAS1
MEHNGGIDDNDRVASPSESALHLFLPPQPARVQVPPPVELPIEQEEMDNAWFSLSLGGGGNVENPPAAPPPSVPSTSAQELHRPAPKARGDLQTIVSRGFCRTGKSSMSIELLSSIADLQKKPVAAVHRLQWVRL